MFNASNKQQSWDQRYNSKVKTDPQPAQVLESNQHLLSKKGMAIDLACGLGGNAIFLARLGYQVTAVDYSAVALEKLADYAAQNDLTIKTHLLDLEQSASELQQCDLIVVSYYLQRSLFPDIFSALNKGGLLFYQTFSGMAQPGSGPSNPAFRIEQGELLSLCTDQKVLFYREDPDCCHAENCINGEAMIVVKRD